MLGFPSFDITNRAMTTWICGYKAMFFIGKFLSFFNIPKNITNCTKLQVNGITTLVQLQISPKPAVKSRKS